jgi:hypothetical protein
MGSSVRPDPVADYLAALKSPASDPVSDYLNALPQKAHDYHAEYRSGALAKRMQGANQRDAANLADEQASQPGYLERAATHVLNAGQGIPGVEAVEAGAGALGSQLTSQPQTYRQSLGTLRGATGQIGGKTAAGERILGSTALLPFLAASPVLAGAELGGADQALSANPDESLTGRAGRTALGAAGGALAGKAAQSLVTGARLLPLGAATRVLNRYTGGLVPEVPTVQTAAANLLSRQADRAASASRLYGQAIAEGQGKSGTAAVKQFLAEPDIADIVDELSQTRQFQGVAKDSPELLDAVYKTLSDRSAQLKKGLDAVTPNRPNIGRFRLQDTKAAQGELLDALGGGTTMPGPMPTYPKAVADFAQRSGDMQGVQRGYDALRTGMSSTLPRAANLTRTTPEALTDWAQNASPSQREAAGEGVLGGVKASYGLGVRKGFKATNAAASVMRQAKTPQQLFMDYLTKGVLTSGNAALSP